MGGSSAVLRPTYCLTSAVRCASFAASLRSRMACENCGCQWGLSGIFGGIIVLIRAGLFTAARYIFGYYALWYWIACWFWISLGAFLLLCGIFLEVRTHNAKARELPF